MKYQNLLLLSLLLPLFTACGLEETAERLAKEEIAGATISDESAEENVSKSTAELQMTIDGEDHSATCKEHYVNIAKERNGMISYSFRYAFDKQPSQLNGFQLTFRSKEPIELPYEVELDFKKSATGNKLKTSLSVFYADADGKIVQTANDVGKVIITELSEDKVVMEVDTKLMLLKTMNVQGEAETVRLEGKINSSYPVVTMMGGVTKEEVF